MADVAHKSQRSESKLSCEVRIAFPFFHEKRTKRADGTVLEKPRWDGVLLFPKLNADAAQCANYAFLAGMCMEAATKAWGSWPQGGKWPIADGDVPYVSKPKPGVTPLTAEQMAAKNSWRVGHWIVEVSANLDPGPRVCVLQNGVAVEIPAKVVNGHQLYKSGDYGFVSMCSYSFSNKTFGVNLGLEGVLFTRPGEAIGSSGPRSASQMFGSVAGMVAPTAPAAPGAAPLPPGPPIPNAAPPAPPAPPAAAAPPIAPGMPPMPPAPAAAALPGMPPLPR